jgi:transposase
MQVMHPICCGIDVHQARLTACVRQVDAHGQVRKEVREFATTYTALLALADWLVEQHCPVVAMESTGVYVRRITARAISLAKGTGSEGNPWVND